MKIDKKLAVLMLAGIVVASAFMVAAEAKPPKPVEVKVTCDVGLNTIDITNGVGVLAGGSCPYTVDGTAYAAGDPSAAMTASDLNIDLMSPEGAGNSLTATITDAPGDQKYHIEGSKGNEMVVYTDDAGNDKLNFNGKEGMNTLTITSVLGDNDYKGDNIGIDPITMNFGFMYMPGTGMDKIHIN
ncbi:MAG: hypothetical protein ABOK23_10455 [Candidatus Methanoperedens sp.]|nr:hypothetical protein [Candidatus Methanoperedens sp.]MCZ7396853.1 hypothetical protein [Candidatus Methanoperedens sp.]